MNLLRMKVVGTSTILFLFIMTSFSKERVLSSRTFQFAHYKNGKAIQVEKILDEGSGVIKVRTDDIDINSMADLEKIIKDDENFQIKNYGAMKGDLRKKYEALTDDEMVEVLIVPKRPNIDHPDKTIYSEEVCKEHSLKIENKPFVDPAVIGTKYGFPIKKKDPEFITTLVTKKELKKAIFDENIAAIEEVAELKLCTDVDFSILSSSAYNPGPVPSNAATGIRAATVESGIWSSEATCQGYSTSQIDIDASATLHSNVMFLVLKNSAQGASLWHRNSYSFNGTANESWIVNNEIRTLSMSRVGSTDPNTEQHRVMDDFAYRYPYPIFCQPTANDGYAYEVNWQNYNGLSVGNVRHTNLNTYQMENCTQARNPDPVYGYCIGGGSAPCAGDRELPSVVAPGKHPYDAGDYTNSCYTSISRGCGTSISAPNVNGMCACVRAANSTFNSWPELVRVAIMLTAHNVDGGYWSSYTDGLDGAGAVSGSDAVYFAKNATYVSSSNTAVVRGYSSGSWYSTTAQKTFNVLIPSVKPTGKHLRIMVTWDSRPDLTNATNTLSDLDLIGGTGLYYSSASYDDNVEMIDVPSAELTANATYQFYVSPVTIRLPPNASYFYWAVGWDWVAD